MPDQLPAPKTRFDIGYLFAEIRELKEIADRNGYGTLAYLLECATIEAKWQVEQQQDAGQERPAE
jgi:hypothetical protein